ncbi:MAG: hypothetical protein OXE52_13780 [Chloroflexi bacterium]|nr:hypothetical protein [Chloroflexota bacterium]
MRYEIGVINMLILARHYRQPLDLLLGRAPTRHDIDIMARWFNIESEMRRNAFNN